MNDFCFMNEKVNVCKNRYYNIISKLKSTGISEAMILLYDID